MATHITNAKQAVDYYMQGVPSEAVRLRSLISTFGTWTGAAEQVRTCLSYPYVFGGARDGAHTATVENIADELEGRAAAYGIPAPEMTLQAFLRLPKVRALLDEYNAECRAGRDDERSSRNTHRSLLATESRRMNDPAPSVGSGVLPALERRKTARERRLVELADEINALAEECGRPPYIKHEWRGGDDER